MRFLVRPVVHTCFHLLSFFQVVESLLYLSLTTYLILLLIVSSYSLPVYKQFGYYQSILFMFLTEKTFQEYKNTFDPIVNGLNHYQVWDCQFWVSVYGAPRSPALIIKRIDLSTNIIYQIYLIEYRSLNRLQHKSL